MQYKTLSAWLRNAGSKNMAVNGSVTPVHFDYVATEDVQIDYLTVTIAETTGNFRVDYYTTSGALTNGLEVKVLDESLAEWNDLVDGDRIKTFGDWVSIGANATEVTPGAGPAAEAFQWLLNVGDAGGLLLPVGYRLRCTVNDDMTALLTHEIHIIGEER